MFRTIGRVAKRYLELAADRATFPGYSYIYNKNLKYWADRLYPKRKKRRMPTGLKRRFSMISRARRTSKNKRRSRRQKSGKFSRTVKSTTTSKGPFLGLYQSQGQRVWTKPASRYAGARRTCLREAKKVGKTQRPQKFIRSWYSNDTTGTYPLITVVDKQNMVVLDPLFAFNGTTMDFDDCKNILGAVVITAPANMPTNNSFQNRVVASGRQEIEIANTGTNLAYLTIYKYVFKQDYYEPDANVLLTGTQSFWNTSGNAAATKITLGATPFDFHEVVHNLVILEKNTVQLQAGETVNFSHSRKNMLLDGNDLDGYTANTMVGKKGVTCGYILQWTGEANASNIASVAKLAVSSIKTYSVTLMPYYINQQTVQNMA